MPKLKEASLDDVCLLVTDGTHDTPKRVNDGFPLIKAKEIVGGKIDFETCDQISEEEHLRVIARSKPEYGDTLFAHIGASLGEAAFIKTHRTFSIKNIALFKPNLNIIDERYLYYLVISPAFQGLAKQTKTGSAQPFLSLGHLRSHRITYNEALNEQRKIATILSAYDDLIENNLRRIKILEEMAQALYREWFVKFCFPGHEKVRMVDSPLGKIPEGWEVVKLGQRVELFYGKGLTKSMRKEGTVPVFGSSGVVGWHNQSIVGGPGIIVGRKGNVGSVFWSETPFYPIDTVFYVRTNLPMHYVYYNLQLQNFINNDAAVPGLNRNQAHSLPFIVPESRTMDKFAKSANLIFRQKSKLKRVAENLRQTRDLLLPKLISGELDVSDLEINIPEEAA